MTTAAMQNGKVWCRRLGVEFDPQAFEAALVASGFTGSVLKGPLTLVFYKKIGSLDWGKAFGRDDRRVVGKLMGWALASVLRGEERNLLAALGRQCITSEEKRLFAINAANMTALMAEAIAARSREKSRPNLTNAVLAKARRAPAGIRISDDPEGYGI